MDDLAFFSKYLVTMTQKEAGKGSKNVNKREIRREAKSGRSQGEVGDDFKENSDLFCFENLKYLLNLKKISR